MTFSTDICPVSLDLVRPHLADLRRTRSAETASSRLSHLIWSATAILSAMSHLIWSAMAVLSRCLIQSGPRWRFSRWRLISGGGSHVSPPAAPRQTPAATWLVVGLLLAGTIGCTHQGHHAAGDHRQDTTQRPGAAVAPGGRPRGRAVRHPRARSPLPHLHGPDPRPPPRRPGRLAPDLVRTAARRARQHPRPCQLPDCSRPDRLPAAVPTPG